MFCVCKLCNQNICLIVKKNKKGYKLFLGFYTFMSNDLYFKQLIIPSAEDLEFMRFDCIPVIGM